MLQAFGWRVVFIMLTLWGSSTLALVATFLPETSTKAPVISTKLETLTGCSSNDSDESQAKKNVERSDSICSKCMSSFFCSVVEILCDYDSASILLTMSIVFSAPASMLSNLSFMLEDLDGLGVFQSSLIIGSIPISMVLAGKLCYGSAKCSLLSWQAN